jgi:hypothetical protein
VQACLVLWQVGTNDVLAGVPVEEFRETVQSTIRWLKEHQIDTVLIGLQYSPAVERNERHKAIGRVINEVAAAENVLLVRRYDAMQFLANSGGKICSPTTDCTRTTWAIDAWPNTWRERWS